MNDEIDAIISHIEEYGVEKAVRDSVRLFDLASEKLRELKFTISIGDEGAVYPAQVATAIIYALSMVHVPSSLSYDSSVHGYMKNYLTMLRGIENITNKKEPKNGNVVGGN